MCQAAILEMMLVFNAHGLDPCWVEPSAREVQQSIDNLSEGNDHDEPLLVEDTIQAEIDYIAARVAEAQLAMEAGGAGGVEDEANTAAEERELAQDRETLAQRVAKKARAPACDQPAAGASRTPVVEISPDSSPRLRPQRASTTYSSSMCAGVRSFGTDLAMAAGGGRQQEEPPRATPNTPPPSTRPPRGASPARAPSTEPMRTEEEEVDSSTGGSVPATDVGGEGGAYSQPSTDLPLADQEDIDAIITEVAKNTEAKADKIATETTTEDAAKGPAGEAGKAAAGEEVVDDQPSSSAASGSSRYLKVGGDLFAHLLGTAGTRAPAEGEVFDDEVLAVVGLEALHRARLDKANSREAEADLEERVAEAQAWFRQAHEELKAAQDQLAERK
nr:uncharacterized protein LOC109736877 [Aegilops tauschii subsp. strangulata]